MTAEERAVAAARGLARMDEARAATGDLTCALVVVGWQQRSPTDIKPNEWAGTWGPR